MSRLTITSSYKRPLKPLIKAAIDNELNLLRMGIRRTEERLKMFEKHFGLSTKEFTLRYNNSQLEETLEYSEWIGEYRLLIRLQEKSQALMEVTIED